MFDSSELAAIAEIARNEDLVVVTDEIYEHIVFDGARHRSLATLDGMRERTVVVNSISKTANATGWRVGWVLSPPHLTPRIRAVHDTLVIQAPTPLQKAAVALLELPDEFFRDLAGAYAGKRALLGDALRAAGFRTSEPRGAYYLFADYRAVPGLGDLDPLAAALHLIEHAGVAAVPGDNFYARSADGARYLRLAFCRSRETLASAAQRLRRLTARGRAGAQRRVCGPTLSIDRRTPGVTPAHAGRASFTPRVPRIQFSTCSFGTRSNSRALFVTSVAFTLRA